MAGDLTKKATRRQALFKRWLALWPITAVVVLYPINNFLLRLVLLLAYAALWGGLLCFSWHRKNVRMIVLGCTAVFALFFFLPGKNPDIAELRQQYLTSLKKYEGVKYIWGGENWLGLDCSGLLRSALIVADYREGICTLNPGLVRAGISLWWHDCSAKALGEQYRHQTRFLFSATNANEINYSKIQPGDMAVTDDGVHILAYLGDEVWIEADPTKNRVTKEKIPTDNPWFSEPVNVLRWVQLDERTSN